MELKLTQTVIKEVLDEMLYLAGHTYSYAAYLNLNERVKQTIKMDQQALDRWMDWGSNHIQDRLGYSRFQAETEMAWIHYKFGISEKQNNI